MAWTPTEFLLRGLLDNRRAGRVIGWLKFVGVPLLVIIDLAGDFEADIRGQRVVLAGPGHPRDGRAAGCMAGFGLRQSGRVVRMTAGRSSVVGQPLFAWHSEHSGPVTLELESWQLQVVGETSLLPIRAALANQRDAVSAFDPSDAN